MRRAQRSRPSGGYGHGGTDYAAIRQDLPQSTQHSDNYCKYSQHNTIKYWYDNLTKLNYGVAHFTLTFSKISTNNT